MAMYDSPISMNDFFSDEDRSRKYIMNCKNHPDLRWRSKNPFVSHIFFDGSTDYGPDHEDECPCHLMDLQIIGRED